MKQPDQLPGNPEAEPKQNKSYYEVLGVSKDASKEALRKAYHNLSRAHNPNVPEEREQFEEIDTAYKTLSDEESRGIYDTENLIDLAEKISKLGDAKELEFTNDKVDPITKKTIAETRNGKEEIPNVLRLTDEDLRANIDNEPQITLEEFDKKFHDEWKRFPEYKGWREKFKNLLLEEYRGSGKITEEQSVAASLGSQSGGVLPTPDSLPNPALSAEQQAILDAQKKQIAGLQETKNNLDKAAALAQKIGGQFGIQAPEPPKADAGTATATAPIEAAPDFRGFDAGTPIDVSALPPETLSGMDAGADTVHDGGGNLADKKKVLEGMLDNLNDLRDKYKKLPADVDPTIKAVRKAEWEALYAEFKKLYFEAKGRELRGDIQEEVKGKPGVRLMREKSARKLLEGAMEKKLLGERKKIEKETRERMCDNLIKANFDSLDMREKAKYKDNRGIISIDEYKQKLAVQLSRANKELLKNPDEEGNVVELTPEVFYGLMREGYRPQELKGRILTKEEGRGLFMGLGGAVGVASLVFGPLGVVFGGGVAGFGLAGEKVFSKRLYGGVKMPHRDDRSKSMSQEKFEDLVFDTNNRYQAWINKKVEEEVEQRRANELVRIETEIFESKERFNATKQNAAEKLVSRSSRKNKGTTRSQVSQPEINQPDQPEVSQPRVVTAKKEKDIIVTPVSEGGSVSTEAVNAKELNDKIEELKNKKYLCSECGGQHSLEELAAGTCPNYRSKILDPKLKNTIRADKKTLKSLEQEAGKLEDEEQKLVRKYEATHRALQEKLNKLSSVGQSLKFAGSLGFLGNEDERIEKEMEDLDAAHNLELLQLKKDKRGGGVEVKVEISEADKQAVTETKKIISRFFSENDPTPENLEMLKRILKDKKESPLRKIANEKLRGAVEKQAFDQIEKLTAEKQYETSEKERMELSSDNPLARHKDFYHELVGLGYDPGHYDKDKGTWGLGSAAQRNLSIPHKDGGYLEIPESALKDEEELRKILEKIKKRSGEANVKSGSGEVKKEKSSAKPSKKPFGFASGRK